MKKKKYVEGQQNYIKSLFVVLLLWTLHMFIWSSCIQYIPCICDPFRLHSDIVQSLEMKRSTLAASESRLRPGCAAEAGPGPTSRLAGHRPAPNLKQNSL